MSSEKVREDRLRRAAKRQKLKLLKSGRRDPNAYDYGVYTLIDDRGIRRWHGRDLDELERYLAKGAR